MSDQTVFNNSQPQTPATNQADSSNVFADQLSMIKNENGEQKYDTLPKAIDALAHSQQYIPQLKGDLDTAQAEIATLQEKLAKTEAVEDVVSRLTAQQQAPQAEVTPQTSGLDENAVETLLANMLDQRASQDTQASNEKLVSDALIKTYGDKTHEVLQTKAAEMGTTVQALQEQSRQNPQLVLAAFATAPQGSPQVTSGSITIPPITPNGPAPVVAPKKSVLMGATAREQADHMREIRDAVYAKHGVVA
jgi:hypothetical protein